MYVSGKKFSFTITKKTMALWLVCLIGCLYPVNVKTAEPIGPFFLATHMTQ